MVGSNPIATVQRLTGGDANASLLLLRIAYWMKYAKIRREGFDWIIKPRSEWATEAGLSIRQLDRALAHLKQKNLIVAEQHLWGKTHQKLAWVRLVPGVREKVFGNTSVAEFGKSGVAEFGKTHIHGDTTLDTTGNPNGLLEPPYSPPTEEVVPGEEDQMKIADVIAKHASPKKNPSPQKPPFPKASAVVLGKVWLKALVALGAGYQSALTQKQLGQLKQIAKQCPNGKAADWLDHTVAQWEGYVLQVKSNYGLDSVPMVPDIGFALKYIGEFVKFNLPAPAPSVKKPVAEVVKSTPVQLIAKSPKKATLEELQAILSEDDKDT